MIQDVEDYTSALNFEANNPAELLVPVQAWPGDSSLGESHRKEHRLPLHPYLRLCQKQHLHLHLDRKHRKHPPRAPTATPCSPVLRALLYEA